MIRGDFEIKKAQTDDIDEILEIFKNSRKIMKESGNPTQWGDDKPSVDTIEDDIKSGDMYKISYKNDKEILGVFVLKDYDLCYDKIYDGKWLNDEPYGVIHRVATNGKARGIMNLCLNFSEGHFKNVRIDTHEDNKIMQHILKKHGYQRCGIIYVEDNTPRIAYQKIVE